ncbi:c-type cytochrome [Paraburkholderia caballeronis]|uniref:Cytochrome c, mono-and diheme variants n=1 Tax=Paraburkholderia caballeronis TaxID=416943 RepID=A0A1H7L6H0_9BURK|nr:cytochrome c [Paraburkholderia caballeronis]PXW28310.1 mono/diheme cytochrome c family protein [Paraburkholderia caballeronis]PXX03676.1 mono/diheme cytochrome c family protein [Paraburkholderia caballeronis]RAK04420.1 mono/diheme cytochrome c family protein [Paraburkholderia caballeronis]SED80910.1 Cytochrome c, mono-and diheme variants [Paraburkholderia caballeronis]SEK94434.1 Cytochrome c, mono-and diheme variants [Paraburkholderia caballeronis]
MNRKRLWFNVAGAAIVGVAVSVGVIWQPTIAPVAPPSPAAFDRQLKLEGAHVVALGDCAVCHTSKNGKPFAGGLPLATPFGTIYATNITPDAQTGIGNWSEQAFARALRYGIARDGDHLYPAFPYVHFTQMSDREIAAAYAYLMSRDPVRAQTPANRLVFPLNYRPLVAFWNLLFLRPGPRDEIPGKDAQWNRGKLLVSGLGHCAACHSPLNAIGGEKSGHAFDGGVVDGWEAPPLNALNRAVRPWTKAQLVAYLRTGRASEHGAAAGPMLPVTRELATVPEDDAEAMAAYLISIQKPVEGNVARPSVSAVAATSPNAAAQRGAAIFAASCAQCHGTGSPMLIIGERPDLGFSTAVNAATPRDAIQTILGGIEWHGEDTTTYMPAFGGLYNDRQIADLVMFLRGNWSTRPAWTDVEASVAKIRQENNAR